MRKMKSTLLPLALFTFSFFHASFLAAAEKEETKAPAALKVEVTGTGRPMILIPGLTCGGNVWDGAVAHFKETCQCHVVTLAGFAGQPAIGEPYLQQVHDALGDYIRREKLVQPVIVGHSMGGFLAFWLGADLPDQVGPIVAVDGVPYYPALMDPHTTPQLQQPRAAMFRQGLAAQSPMQFAINNQFILATMISDAKNVEMVASLSNKSDPKAVGQAYYEIMTTDLREKVKSIRSPVLLIAATDPAASADEQQREEAGYRAQVDTIPNHKVIFAPKSRHFIQLDAPDFFLREVDSFLKEASGGTK